MAPSQPVAPYLVSGLLGLANGGDASRQQPAAARGQDCGESLRLDESYIGLGRVACQGLLRPAAQEDPLAALADSPQVLRKLGGRRGLLLQPVEPLRRLLGPGRTRLLSQVSLPGAGRPGEQSPSPEGQCLVEEGGWRGPQAQRTLSRLDGLEGGPRVP